MKSITKLSDPSVFESVFHEQYDNLCGFAYRYVDEHHWAEEIVQGVFADLWEKAEEIKIRTTVESYLFGAVRHACLNHLKHQQVENKFQEFSKNNPDQVSQDFLELSELEEEIKNALESLPEKCREIFEMSRFEEMKYKEISETLNISQKTVETQISRALKVLRKALNHYLGIIFF